MIEFARGIFQLEIPLPFAMKALNAWLVDSGDGWVLIDCGMHTAAGWSALEREVASAGVDWNEIRTLLITHMHPDHVGLAPRVKQSSGAAIGMHHLDAALLNEFAKPDTADHWNRTALEIADSPLELIGPVNAAFHLLTVKFPSLSPDLLLSGGERFGSLEAVFSPGHSPGHLCFFDRRRKLLFSGDHILETTSPNIGWLPDGNPLDDYLTSLQQLATWDIETVLPGHGAPIHQHQDWIHRAIAHHADRLERIRQIVSQHPTTAHQVTAQLWERPLDPIHYRFAIFEVLAHLMYLDLQSVTGRNGTLWHLK